jgi:hypothetical protein
VVEFALESLSSPSEDGSICLLSLGYTLEKNSSWLDLHFKPCREGPQVEKEGGTTRLIPRDESVWEGGRKAGNMEKPHPDACSESIGPCLQN